MDEPQSPAPPPIIQVQIVPRTLSAEEQAAIDQALKKFTADMEQSTESMKSFARGMALIIGICFGVFIFFLFAMFSRH